MKPQLSMEKEKLNQKFLQSTIYTKYGDFFVSTIYRRSSAINGGWYYETFAWKLDKEGKSEQKIIADNSGSLSSGNAIRQHTEVLTSLDYKGSYERPDL